MINQKHILSLLCILLFPFLNKSEAQSPDWIWAKGSSGQGNGEYATALAVDDLGNAYATGYFDSIADFNPGAGNILHSHNRDIFIWKVDSAGNFIWVKQFAGPSVEVASAIALDPSDNVYTTGYFSDTVDFNPDTSLTYYLQGETSYGDVFISKLDSAGNFIWAKSVGGILSDKPYAITANDSAVYITGFFRDSVDFDPGPGIYKLYAGTGISMFVLKLDANGNFLWADAILNGPATPYSIKTDAENIFIAGAFIGTADFDPGSGVHNIVGTSTVNPDVFILKLNQSGDFIWVKSIGNSFSNDVCRALAIDASENIYTSGFFSGLVDFNPGTAVSNLNSIGNVGSFILKLDSAGNYIWAKAISGVVNAYAYAVSSDNSNNVYASGSFYGTADFDPGPATYYISTTPLSASDIFILKLDSAGNFIWAKTAGGTSPDECHASALHEDYLYITGINNSTVLSFGAIDLIDSVNSHIQSFIAKLDHTVITGQSEIVSKEDEIYLTPNPASDHFRISSTPDPKSEFEITDTSGKLFYTSETGKDKSQAIDVTEWPHGIYIVKITSHGFTETKKLVVL
jgi:hypothetical protein